MKSIITLTITLTIAYSTNSICQISCPPAYVGECGENDHPDVTGWPTFEGNPIDPTYLCYTATYSDNNLNECGNGVKITRNWSITNTCSQPSSNCSQIIKLSDTEGPNLTCPSDIQVPCNLLDPEDTGFPTVVDQCGSDFNLNFSNPPIQINCPTNQFVRTWTATDDCGNVSVCNHTVTISCRPTVQARLIVFSGVTGSSITLDWQNGNGSQRIVKINTVNTFTTPPDGSDFPANTIYNMVGVEQVVYNGNGDMVTVTGLSSNTTYWFRVYEGLECNGMTYFLGTTANGNPKNQKTSAGTGINIASSLIPPWQREGDLYQGFVTVSTTPPGSNWHLQVRVTSIANGNLITTINYPSISGSTQNFSSVDPQLQSNSLDGRRVTFFAVSDANGSSQQAGITNIIQRKWDYRNHVSFKNGMNITIKIPIKYKTTNPVTHVLIVREGNVSRKTSLGIPGLAEAPTLKNNSGLNLFNLGNDGYVTLTANNSTIEDVFPGDFKVEVYTGAFVDEVMYFDLTKFGLVFSSSSPTNKIAIIVGGIFNEIESSITELQGNQNDSSLTYSMLTDLKNNGFDIWYIAQGNANSMKRNGFDIGIALDSIRLRNPTKTEFDIVCHSKGGLDVRAYLSGFTESYSGTLQNSYYTSLLYGKIKKVLFLGTPHHGANLAVLGIPLSALFNCPGAQELSSILTPFSVLYMLNHLPLPFDISFANLAGYRAFYIPLGFGAYNISNSDGIVSVNSNNYLLGQFPNNSIKQLYQHSLTPPNLSHFNLHQTDYLTYSNVYLDNISCLSSMFPTNLEKIIAFFNGSPPYGDTFPFESCPEPDQSQILFGIYGSIVPNASIYHKPFGFPHFFSLGNSNEQGILSSMAIPAIQTNDSVLIKAEGYHDILFTIDSISLATGKIPIPLVPLISNTQKVQSPSFLLKNNIPLSDKDSIDIILTSLNTIKLEINIPSNQDSIFTELNSDDTQFRIKLDSGLNNVIVRFISEVDTVIIKKNIYFFPDTLFDKLTYKVFVTSDSTTKGTSIYVSNDLYKVVNTEFDSFPLLLGENLLRFMKFGATDSVILVDSSINIDLTQILREYSHDFPDDSIVTNFAMNTGIHYSRGVTTVDTSRTGVVTFKQIVKDFSQLSLLPGSRVFEYTKVNGSSGLNLESYIILDQEEVLSKEEIYLLRIIDDTIYKKLFFPHHPNILSYQSEIQKLTYKNLNFNVTGKKEQLVLMKKQGPVNKPLPTLFMSQKDSLILLASQIIADPDSLKGDLTIEVIQTSSDLKINFDKDKLILKSNDCFIGTTSFMIKSVHDDIETLNTLNVVVVPFIPEIVNFSDTLCQGVKLLLSANSEGTYLWNTGDTTQSIEVDQEGIYFVEVIDSNGCKGISNESIINFYGAIDTLISFSGPVIFCYGESVILSAAPGYNYLWSTGDTSQALNVFDEGSYSITLYDQYGCTSNSYPIQVGVNPLPLVNLGPDTSLQTNTYILDAGNSGATFQWSTDETTQSISVTIPGWYSVTVTDMFECTGSDSVFVDFISGINPQADKFKIKIVPNPNTGEFTLSGAVVHPSDINIVIVDLLGQSVFQSKTEIIQNIFNQNITLNRSGLYFVWIIIGDTKIFRKVLVLD